MTAPRTKAEKQHEIVLGNSMAALINMNPALQQTNLTSFIPMLTNNIYAPLTLNWTLLMYFYKTHGIIQAAIDEPVEDAYRDGLEIISKELSEANIQELQDDIEELEVLDRLIDVGIWARLFGGSALIVNCESDPSKPLNYEDLEGQRMEFYDVTRWELSSATRLAKHYRFRKYDVDASRILTMNGKRQPFIIRWQLAGWGASEVESMVEDFNTFIRTNNVLYEILDEAKVDVYKLDGLNENFATATGTEAVRRRLAVINQVKNFQNALILDKNDDYEQKQMSFAGLAEVKKDNRIGLATALRMPFSKLFGTTAGGGSLANSAQDDLENYNAKVEKDVRQKHRPTIRQVLKMLVWRRFGADLDVRFKFRPLRVLDAIQEETVKTSKHNRFLALYDRMIITAQELAEMNHKEGMLPVEIAALTGAVEDHPQPDQDGPGDRGPGQGDRNDGKDRKPGSEKGDDSGY